MSEQAGNDPSLVRRIATGTAWTVAMRVVIRLIGLASTVILARLLAPADFGLVAMATLLLAFLDAVSEMSFDVALIQNQHASRSHYDTVWTMSIIRGVVSALIIVASANIAARFFAEPRLSDILHWLAFGAIISGFINVGIVDFRKHMAFDKDFRFMVLAKSLAFVATIVSAVVLRDYRALIIGIIVLEAFRVAISFVMSPYRPRLCLRDWREIFGFSKWLLLGNVLRYLQGRTDTLVIGKLIGPAALGVYSVAYEIAALATTEVVAPIRRTLLPGYALISADAARMRRGYIQGMALIFAIGAPIAAGVGLTAEILVPLFLGPKWTAAVPLLRILAIGGLLQIGTANTGPVLNAIGRPKLLTVALFCSVVLGVPIMIWSGIHWGAHGVAWGMVATWGVLSALCLILSARAVGVGGGELIAATWRTFVSLLIMAVAVIALIAALPESRAYYVLAGEILLASITGASIYISVHLLLWWLSGMPEEAAEERLRAAAREFRRRFWRAGLASRW